MKLYTKLVSFLCAAVMLLSLFAACAETNGETTDPASDSPATTADPSGSNAGNTTDPAPVTTTDPNYDENGYLKSELPELNYNGKKVTILHWKDVERPEFEILESEQGLDLVKDSIYERNVITADKLSVEFEWVGQPGNSNNVNAFVSYVQNCKNNGDFYDVIATYSRTAASLSANGLLTDLNTVEDSYLDLEKPWWPEAMVETCSMKDSLFFISGDISTNLLHMMYAIYYNMDMVKDLGLEDPVKLVDNKTWTIAALIGMTKDVYSDLDMSGTPTDEDRFGFTSNYFHLEAFYSGSDMMLLEAGDDGDVLKISDDYTSTKCVDLVDTLAKWFAEGDTYVNPSGGNLGNDLVFYEGRALFTQNRAYIADNQYAGGKLRNAEWEYGILPNPLYDENQEDYITLLGNPFTHWCIMDGARDASMSTAVIECMASEAYRRTSPALFEMNMKYRYTPDSSNKGDSARMFDIIRENISFDLGRMFAVEMSYISEQPLRAALAGQSWATVSKQKMNALKRNLVTLNKGLAETIN